MVINDIDYALTENNYIAVDGDKTQIVLTSTFNHDMRHFIGWRNRYNGNYKKTAAFTISSDGVIYKHFEPKFQSNILGNSENDLKSIVVLIENDGWLLKDGEENRFITWIGDIYNKPDEVFEKRWRNYKYWAAHSKEQFESAIMLVKTLCFEFNIPTEVIGHNTKVDSLKHFNGVIYKSNIEKHYTDLNPSWDCAEFKNKIEEL
jgi:hypothetical protein